MVNFAGLEYDRDGAGATYAYNPVNNYFDYQMPIEDPSLPATNAVRVLAQRVRNSFSAQNVEVNFIRFPICNTFRGSGFCTRLRSRLFATQTPGTCCSCAHVAMAGSRCPAGSSSTPDNAHSSGSVLSH